VNLKVTFVVVTSDKTLRVVPLQQQSFLSSLLLADCEFAVQVL